MKELNFSKISFATSANELSQLPKDSNAEIAFAGRSNSGKSSTLNAITNNSKLAKTSKTPGRTQLLNFFKVVDHKYFVDLPGYGYAKVAAAKQKHWEKTLGEYLETREELRGIVITMDIRHPLTDTDLQLLEVGNYYSIPMHILLTKADKLKRGAAKNTLYKVQQELQPLIEAQLVSIQLFSSLDGQGLPELKQKLGFWLG